jgi:flagellar biosynthesis/type III secretory pathway protein FliH
MISQDRQLRTDYERRRMAHHDAVSLRRDSWLEGNRQGIDEGKRQGIDEGKRLGIDEGKRLGIDEGRHVALVEALIAVLQARGLPLSDAQRARIDAETDLARLKGWVTRAAAASSVEAVLSE